jgi:hypothetical protein
MYGDSPGTGKVSLEFLMIFAIERGALVSDDDLFSIELLFQEFKRNAIGCRLAISAFTSACASADTEIENISMNEMKMIIVNIRDFENEPDIFLNSRIFLLCY